jgi:hypothetical protein
MYEYMGWAQRGTHTPLIRLAQVVFEGYMHNTITVLNDFLTNGHTHLPETNLLQLNEKK